MDFIWQSYDPKVLMSYFFYWFYPVAVMLISVIAATWAGNLFGNLNAFEKIIPALKLKRLLKAFSQAVVFSVAMFLGLWLDKIFFAPSGHGKWLTAFSIFILAVWIGFIVLDSLTRLLFDRCKIAGKDSLAAAVPLLRKTLKVLLVTTATLLLLQNFGVNITALIAGLGVGGLAVALAAQKTVENFFGGIMLIVDQPVREGDFCRWDSMIGTVESIGLRTTRIRTLDRTLVSIPNGDFSQKMLENFASRDKIRLFAIIGLRYETTPDQLRYILVEIKKLLLAHPGIDPDPARVRFIEFGDYALKLEIFAFSKTADWDQFLALREDVFLRLADIVAASGSSFAFPTSTIMLEKGTGLDLKKSRLAEQKARKMIKDHKLPLPFMKEEQAQKYMDTINYQI
jgi:MscS family membrane protein